MTTSVVPTATGRRVRRVVGAEDGAAPLDPRAAVDRYHARLGDLLRHAAIANASYRAALPTTTEIVQMSLRDFLH
jgi:hypothetical protein